MAKVIGNNLPGVTTTFNAEQPQPLASGSKLTLMVVPVDSSSLQSTFDKSVNDGYIAANAGSTDSVVVFDAPTDLEPGQYAGLYLYDGTQDEARQIADSSAAASGAEVTVYLAEPFTAAVAESTELNVRRWEKLKIPKRYGSSQEFFDDYLEKNSDGSENFTAGHKSLAYSLELGFVNSMGSVIVCPVESSSDASVMAANLDVTGDTDFLEGFGKLSQKPDLIMVPKQPSMESFPSVAEWADVDTAWLGFVQTEKSLDTATAAAYHMQYLASTPTRSNSVGVTYRTTTLNSSSSDLALYHGRGFMSSFTNPSRPEEVDLLPAMAGIINRISVGAPGGSGHSFSGSQYSKVFGVLGLAETLTPTQRKTLDKNGVNAFVSKTGGISLHGQLTQAKTTSTNGTLPSENLNVVVSQKAIVNALEPILDFYIEEVNTVDLRSRIVSSISQFLTGQKDAGVISGKNVVDITSQSDVLAKIGRFKVSLAFTPEMKFITLVVATKLG